MGNNNSALNDERPSVANSSSTNANTLPSPSHSVNLGPYQHISQYQHRQRDHFEASPILPSEMNYGDDEPILEQQYPFAGSLTSSQNHEEINLEEAVKLSLRLKKKVVQSSSFNTQRFPMLASLMVDSLTASKKAAIDLICVIDHSGSMSGEKIELVKQTFNYLLNYLGDADRLSIVIFDDQASRLIPLVRTTEINKQRILSALRDISGRGGTDINLGMTHAFQVLKQRRQMNPVSSIFLLSDGLDGGAQQKVKATLNQVGLPSDVTINTFGFGSDHDPQLMNDIAELRDGSFYFVKELDTVDEAFVDCLGGLISAVAQSVMIRIQAVQSEVLEGVDIVKAYGDASMWNKDGQTYITKISNLISGRQRDFILELQIPINNKELQDHQKDIIVAKAEAEITALDGKKVTKTTDLHITLLNEVEEVKDQEEDDKEVMKNFYRVKGASIIDDARKLADQRKNEEAKKILQNFKEELANSALKGEEFIINLIKDIENTIANVNPVVYEQVGKHEMMSNARAQWNQKSNLTSANCYQNDVQAEMLQEVRSKKSNKKSLF